MLYASTKVAGFDLIAAHVKSKRIQPCPGACLVGCLLDCVLTIYPVNGKGLLINSATRRTAPV